MTVIARCYVCDRARPARTIAQCCDNWVLSSMAWYFVNAENKIKNLRSLIDMVREGFSSKSAFHNYFSVTQYEQ